MRVELLSLLYFFFSSRRRHTRYWRDWSSDVCSSDLAFFWLAFALPLAPFDTRADLSYGTYIYAFPVQQGLALLHLPERGFGLYFAGSLLTTLLLAFLSYRLIEAP